MQLAVQRLEVSDRVAAAKFGTGQPVTDPSREAVVLADARANATHSGVDSEWVARVFADQIAASTQVQNNRIREWTDRPDSRPDERPDLAQIRPELDRIGEELVTALKVAAPARMHDSCSSSLSEASTTQIGALDAVRRAALDQALMSICDATPS